MDIVEILYILVALTSVVMVVVIGRIKALLEKKRRKKRKRATGWDYYTIKKRTILEWFVALPEDEKVKVLSKWVDSDALNEWYCTKSCVFRNNPEDCYVNDDKCLNIQKEELIKTLINSEYKGELI